MDRHEPLIWDGYFYVCLRQTQKTTPEVHEGREVMKERKADGKPKQTVTKKRRRVRKSRHCDSNCDEIVLQTEELYNESI